MRRTDQEIRIGASYPGGCSRNIALEPAAVQLRLYRQAIMRSLSPVHGPVSLAHVKRIRMGNGLVQPLGGPR